MSTSASSTGGGIQPTRNDVLFGRGAGVRMREGNLTFLSIVQQYKTAYATSKHKTPIAEIVFNRVKSQSPPGRFLEPFGDALAGDLWCEVDDDKALAKIKQALRNPDRAKHAPAAGTNYEAVFGMGGAGGQVGSVPTLGPIGISPWQWQNSLLLYSDPFLHVRSQLAVQQQGMPPSLSPGIISAALHGNVSRASGLMSMGGMNPHIGVNLQTVSTGCSQAPLPRSLLLARNSNQAQADESSQGIETGKARARTAVKRSHADQSDVTDEKNSAELTETRGATEDLDGEDTEAAQFLFSAMTETITQAIAAINLQDQQTTEEERDEATADLLGIFCEGRHDSKRLRENPVSCMDSLLQEMKAELGTIPSFEKLALTEAEGLALPVEFTDRRLELFLRRESWNPKKAARRFVTYWEERRKLFGPEKFHLPMTLKGAMRDDIECLKNGPFYHLPAVDASGRIIVGVTRRQHFHDSYDYQSLQRSFWFQAELSSNHPNAPKGFVRYVNMADASMWDIDHEFLRIKLHWEKTALPVANRGTHICCLPRILTACAKPLAQAKLSKDSRMRVVIHDCATEKTAEALAEYGIPPHVVPKELGGKCDIAVERKKWLTQLRKLDDKAALESDTFVWWEL